MTDLMRFPSAKRHELAIDAWFDAKDAAIACLARAWFRRLRDCGQDVRELMHDGQATACVGNAAFAYVAIFRAHANIGFFQGAGLPDPAGILEGTGKRMRHVKLRPGTALNGAALEALVLAAYQDMRRRVESER
jgi:hypothetical protein